VAGRYTVLDMIGAGGMGCIYRVHDNTLKEEVALKTLLPQFARDQLVVDRFYNEARIARQLSHVGIVRVHDIGLDGKVLYISMEYLKGQSLRDLMDRAPGGRSLEISTILRVFDELCACLEYAHKFTVHRDIKPENVMINETGAVKLMDFGISKLVTHTAVTATSVVMGTPHYMSPEQLKDSSKVDGRADVYSMGVMLYEVITGNVPMGVPKPTSQLRNEIPAIIDDIVARCLEPEADDRYQTIIDLRDELRHARAEWSGEPTEDLGVAAGARRRRGGGVLAKLRPLAAVVSVSLVLFLAVFAMLQIEQRWSGLVAGASQFEVDGIAVPSAQDDFAKYERLIAQAQGQAAMNPGELGRPIMDKAKAAWANAQAADELGQVDRSLDAAWEALQCYIGVAITYPGMVFIPPGDAAVSYSSIVSVDGFYMDIHEATNGEYSRFLQDQRGAITAPPDFGFASPPGEPIVNVTVYNALAYAAHMKKELPSEAQWARAACGDPADNLIDYPWVEDGSPTELANVAYPDSSGALAPVGDYQEDASVFGVMDVVGNVSELTRSLYWGLPYDEFDGREDLEGLTFGASVALRGGNFMAPPEELSKRWSYPYEGRAPNVGFRCIKAIPRDFAAIQALLDR
jgi:hypothetical protein